MVIVIKSKIGGDDDGGNYKLVLSSISISYKN